MKRKPTDYTTQMLDTAERQRQLKAQEQDEKKREEAILMRQAQSLGQAVLAVFESGITVDRLTGLLHENLERQQANPALEQEWDARGEAFFRPATQRKPAAETKRATGNGHAGNGHDAHEDAEHGLSPGGPPAPPPPARTPAPRGTPDLLNGLAPTPAGQSTPAEGGSDEHHP